MSKRYLFVVAHPDDEVLGAGGFIYEAAKRGNTVGVAVLNTCDTTRYQDDLGAIKNDLDKSHEILGVSKCYKFDYDDSTFNSANHRKMVQDIEGCIRDFRPDVIITQHPGDVNTDHYWTAASCMEAFHLWQRGREDIPPITGLYLMEVQSSTDWALNPSESRFQPNTFVPISPEAVYAKIRALEVYENVIRERPHPRSYEALTVLPILRGAQSGLNNAEAFQCVFRRGEMGEL